MKIYHVLNEFHADQTYQLLAEFRRSPAPVDKSWKIFLKKVILKKRRKRNKTG